MRRRLQRAAVFLLNEGCRRRRREERAGDRTFEWTVAALVAAYAAVGFKTWPHVVTGRQVTAELDEAAQWSRGHLPAEARILIHDAGYFAWATPFALFDIARRSRVTHAVILNDEFWGDLTDDLRRHGWGLKPVREPAARGYVIYELTSPAS